jgi:hypothetical protein
MTKQRSQRHDRQYREDEQQRVGRGDKFGGHQCHRHKGQQPERGTMAEYRGKIGNEGPEAEAYSDALAVGTLDPERSDVLSKVRKDFDAAGVVQSDEQILRVMNELTLRAGNQMPVTRGGAADTLAVMLAKKLTSQ